VLARDEQGKVDVVRNRETMNRTQKLNGLTVLNPGGQIAGKFLSTVVNVEEHLPTGGSQKEQNLRFPRHFFGSFFGDKK
jgi:hypothetical protein